MKKKKIVILILVNLILALLLLIIRMNLFNQNSETDQKTEEVLNTEDNSENIVNFKAVGDIIAHDSVNENALTQDGDYDYTYMFDEIEYLLEDSDILFANEESLSDEDYPITGYPSFNAPTDLEDSLYEEGFNLISVANNHSTDISSSSLQKTTDYYQTTYGDDVHVSGFSPSCDEFSYETFEVNGISFTFSAFTDIVNVPENVVDCNLNIVDDENYQQNINDLTSTGDVNMVSLHFGEEGSSEITAEEQATVDNLLDSGVEVILGTHPHVLKPIEKTTNSQGNDAIVAYSLGNFLHTQLEDDERIGGVLEFTITKGDDDKITIDQIIFNPTYMYYDWEIEDDIDSRYNLKIIPLTDVFEFDSEYYYKLVEILDSAIDEQYLPYIPKEPYSDMQQVQDTTDQLMLVNKNSCLGESYDPEELVIPDVELSTRTTDDVHTINGKIENNIIDLFDAASDAGYNLVFVSGYRDYLTQESLYNSYVDQSGVAEADEFSARPGCSEHQTGLAFDISERSVDADGVDAFTGTESANWVEENAHLYGFIVRYPEDKQAITQYTYESWHLRYVGVDNATYIYENNLSLEEYLFEIK